MKTPLLFILFIFFSLLTFSQTSIDSLEKEKLELKDKILDLNERLTIVENQILKVEADNILKDVKSKPILAIARKGGYVLTKPSTAGSIKFKLEEDTPVQILDFYDRFYQVCMEEKCGYMAAVFINSNKALDSVQNILKERKKIEAKVAENEKSKQIELKLVKKQEEREKEDARMLKKYGKAQYDKMKKRLFWIGMNEEMLLFSLGEPEDINTSGGSWGTHEQWIYTGDTYIYLENGKVTSYQLH